MSIYSRETLERVANERYAECEAIIIEMSDIVKTVRPDFSTDIALGQYDLILQACLLNAAVSDGEFLPEEKSFIIEIAKHADIVPLLNNALKSQRKEPIDWNTIDDLDKDSMKNLAMVAGVVVKSYAREFVEIFAVVDKVVEEKSYFDLIYKATGLILVCVMGIDGDDLKGENALSEATAGLKMFNTLVKNRWEEILNEKKK